MKITPHFLTTFLAMSFLFASDLLAQATAHGYVRTMTGLPIANATVQLVTLNQIRVTNDSGYYDFAQQTPVHPFDARADQTFSLSSKAGKLYLGLDRKENISVSFFDLSGKLLNTIDARQYLPGIDPLNVPYAVQNKTIVAKVDNGTVTSCFKFTMVGGDIVGLVAASSALPAAEGMSKAHAAMAVDSICVTHANYGGGLDLISTRRIKADTGLNNFRMFSNDTSSTGWYASTMNFVFTPDSPGVSYYQQKVPDYKFEERQTQREIEQCFWRSPADVPTSKRYSTYTCNINGNSGVPSGDVATTGGNTLNFNPSYISGKSWWEIIGVQHHEMNHSYQPWYDMSGVSGFGESMPDCIRCLTGFFYWPAGTKCSGGINQAYQPGAHYWYFIELRHPGFIYGLYKLTSTTNIATAVQQVTGESLDTLCKQCEAQGMPYTLGRGSF